MRLIAACIALALASPADAAEYETFIDVESEQDLRDLLTEGEISSDTYETLLDLYRRGVNLSTASREQLYTLPNLTYAEVDAIIAYRKEAGFVEDLAALVIAGVLTERKLAAIAVFLEVTGPERRAVAAEGFVRVPSVYVAGTEGAPPAALHAHVAVDDFDFGLVGVVSHNRLGEVSYDPVRMALSAKQPGTRAELPKVFAKYETDKLEAIVGTYRIGFGQRLTFDNTSRSTPNGIVADDRVYFDRSLSRSCRESGAELESPCTGEARYEYDTPDFSWSEGLMGAAVGGRRIEAGPGWLQAYGFGSMLSRNVYQYQLFDRGVCDDPRSEDESCSSPDVYKGEGDLLDPTTRFSYHTLPNMFRETLVGGNLSYFWDDRSHIGLTGYGADITWLTSGIDLDFQEWARFPFGGGFGAVGVDAAWGSGRNDVFAEVTRSVDNMDGGGGGFGGIVRSTTNFRKSEIEASLRYYDEDFANPYGRPIAAPDTLEGNRARDEAGGRVKYSGTIDKQLTVRASADVYTQPSESSSPRAALQFRSDFELSPRWRPGVWLSYQSNVGPDDSQITDTTVCTVIPGDTTASDLGEGSQTGDGISTGGSGQRAPCDPQRFKAEARVRWQPRRKLWSTARFQMDFIETNDDLMKSMVTWLSVTGWATDHLRGHARVSYRYENMCLWGDDELFDEDDMPIDRSAGDCLADLFTGSPADSFERTVWANFEVLYRHQKKHRVRARYDVSKRLDDRSSTADRDPSPEHWLFVEIESRF